MAVILLLDDDEMLRGLLAEILQEEGHTIIQSENGLAAFNIANMGAVDLMITDLYMPRVDGLEAILNARKDRPEVPIIAMSAGGTYVKTDFLIETKKFGVREVLHKPFHPQAFRETVRKVLGESNAPVRPQRMRARAS